MPTITVADLQRLIQSASYEQYARGRSREVVRPQSGNPYRKPRSRSRSKSRSRSLSRPRSAPRTRNGITFNENINDQLKNNNSIRTRPQSAKSMLSLNSHKESDLDFTGLTNMMSGLKLNQWRKWRSKTDINSKENQNRKSNNDLTDRQRENKPRKFVNAENKDLVKNKDSNPNALRKSRSSSYSKFRYPLQHHSVNVKNNNARLVMEHNIPACLRRFPKYINQPVRHKCTYNPPVRPVTKVKTHSIKSDSLPSSRTTVVTSKPPLPPQIKPPAMIDSQHDEFDREMEEYERNGSYHYVYNGPPTRFGTGDDELREDELPETARISQILPDSDDVIPAEDHFGEVDANVTKIIPDDNKSNNTDDMFQEDDYNFDHVNGNFDDDDVEEKKSYGDINDLHSMGEISEDGNLVKKTPPISNHNKVTKQESSSSEDEIEEDIPQSVAYKPSSFTSSARVHARQVIKV